jgi:hypothetical protein
MEEMERLLCEVGLEASEVTEKNLGLASCSEGRALGAL